MATIKIKRETHNISYQKDDGELITLFGTPEKLASNGTTIDFRDQQIYMGFSETDTIEINGAPFTGTAKEIVAKLRDEVFIDTGSAGGGGELGYLVYTALLSQTGTDAPVATVLENTLGGTVVWTRQDTGIYIGTLADVFIENKTVVFAFLNNANSFEIQAGWLAGAIMIVTYDETWSNIDMTGGGAIEIRVYPV